MIGFCPELSLDIFGCCYVLMLKEFYYMIIKLQKEHIFQMKFFEIQPLFHIFFNKISNLTTNDIL